MILVVGSQTPWLEVVLLARSNLQIFNKSEEGTGNFDNDHLPGNQKKLSP